NACREEKHQREDIQELLHKLLNDLQIIENSSNAIAPVLPIKEPNNSLSMGDEHLSTIPEMESHEVIKSSVEDLVPILNESEDTSGSDSESVLPSDDESLSDEDVPKENVKTYSNPLFEFDDEYISSDINPLFDEGFADEPPLKENDDLFDLESKTNDWKKIVYDAPIDDLIFDSRDDIDEIDTFLDVFLDHDPRSLKDINDLKIMVKVFDPGILEEKFSPTYVSLSFEDRHYLSFTYVIQTFLPYFAYPVVSPFPLSSGSEDIIFYPGISAFHFSSLEPVAYECPMEVCSST
nr:hypothetical protein [Tanacetum cinerariifolium]